MVLLPFIQGLRFKMRSTITVDQAESIALQALTFLAQNPDLLGEFLVETGIGPQDLKTHLKEPTLLGGILDFLINRPDVMMEYASHAALMPKDILLARLHFPGANREFWVTN